MQAYDQLKALASEHDASRSDRYARLDDKLRSLISRLLPRIILHNEPFNLSYSSLIFKTESKGRPYLKPPPGFRRIFDFNCTHDHDYVCCGYLTGDFANANASARIGVDVMKLVNPFVDCSAAEMLDTLRDQLDEVEVKDVEARIESEEVERLLQYWAHKEALVKATGEGVGAGLQRYRVTFGEKTTLHEKAVESKDWRFHEIRLDDHLLVVALHLPGFSDPPDLSPKLVSLDVHEFVKIISASTV